MTNPFPEPPASPSPGRRARAAAERADRVRRELRELAGSEQPDAQRRLALLVAVEAATAAAGRAAAWVFELAARTADFDLAEFGAAVLTCGQELDPADHDTGGVSADVALVLNGFVLPGTGLTAGERRALTELGAAALALSGAVAGGRAAADLPPLTARLDGITGTGRAAA
ncbi:hypothetical protein VM98_01715 [Streptomyces rubellomurinus subsp. indigoferus]|nr:hypothetical protein VM98_01715 [Streptomyces rubellomurinus subsp. indigoferus]